MASLKGALQQAGHREQEDVAYTKYALHSEFENTARQYEAEARVVRDHEVADAARQASQQSGQRVSYLESNVTQLKSQLNMAVRGETAYQSEPASS